MTLGNLHVNFAWFDSSNREDATMLKRSAKADFRDFQILNSQLVL
jgi:hypothetical protein